MKIFKLMVVALVAMVGLNSCSKDCNHDFIERDYSNDIVGTWTCLKADFAEALVFRADGTFSSVGVAGGEYWEYPNATWSLKNNKLALSSGDYKSNVVLEIIPGNCLALVDEKGNRNVFDYCANDLSDELVGMWVSTDAPTGNGDAMTVQIYKENGKAVYTGFGSYVDEYVVNDEATYKVIGDMLFYTLPKEGLSADASPYIIKKLTYAPDGNAYGDIMVQRSKRLIDGKEVEATSSMLRIKQDLDLANQKYDYIKTYVTNVSGEDKDIDFMGYTFNFAKMDGSGLDKMLKSLLFAVEFPDKNNLSYSYQMNGNKEVYNAPIVVEGNKMTIKMSAKVPTLKDIVLYAFQDADCTQLHFYMHKTAFVNFYTNMQAMLAAAVNPEFDITNADTIAAIYNEINDAVDTINVSLVMSK